jgi:hypothetical protein
LLLTASVNLCGFYRILIIRYAIQNTLGTLGDM